MKSHLRQSNSIGNVTSAALRRKRQQAFTIVELLIVIVVIAILATISVVAYNGIQVRARDSRRSSDVVSVLKALESYRALYGNYPTATPQAPDDFERSTDPKGTFMEYLTPQFFGQTPVDPINDATHQYRYFVYSVNWLAGEGCPSDRGRLMVFFADGFEGTDGKPENDPTLSCGIRSWSGNATRFFRYSFENG